MSVSLTPCSLHLVCFRSSLCTCCSNCMSAGTCAGMPASAQPQTQSLRTALFSSLTPLLEGGDGTLLRRQYSLSCLLSTERLENEGIIFMPAQAVILWVYPHHFHTVASKKKKIHAFNSYSWDPSSCRDVSGSQAPQRRVPHGVLSRTQTFWVSSQEWI